LAKQIITEEHVKLNHFNILRPFLSSNSSSDLQIWSEFCKRL